MKMASLGDSAVLFYLDDRPADAAAQLCALRARLENEPLPGVIEIVPAFLSLAVYFDPLQLPLAGLGSVLAALKRWFDERTASAYPTSDLRARTFEIPVCYGVEYGPDLENVAQQTRLPAEQILERHAASEYEVRAIGFSPGFPYLSGLAAELACKRRATPRTRVPAGSVAIGGEQAGVYPLSTPGGWNILGRTPWRLFDVDCEPVALLQIGDRVRFKAISLDEFGRAGIGPIVAQQIERPPTEEAEIQSQFTVQSPGMLTTVQDLGRVRFRAQGVPVGGAADPVSARIANLIVGNSENAPVLECTQIGPELVFDRDVWIAVCGAKVVGIDGGRPVRVRSGEILSLKHFQLGARAYVAVAGGIVVPKVLESASTYPLGGFGGKEGRPLRAGDELAVGASRFAIRENPHWAVGSDLLPRAGSPATLRVLRGAQWDEFPEAAHHALVAEIFSVSPHADRMGVRLHGAGLRTRAANEMTSEPVCEGAVQVPPDGNPIVLSADAQTIGGYPKIGHVITVDLPIVAQLRPGDRVQFRETTLAHAHELLRAREAGMAKLKIGLAQRRG